MNYKCYFITVKGKEYKFVLNEAINNDSDLEELVKQAREGIIKFFNNHKIDIVNSRCEYKYRLMDYKHINRDLESFVFIAPVEGGSYSKWNPKRNPWERW